MGMTYFSSLPSRKLRPSRRNTTSDTNAFGNHRLGKERMQNKKGSGIPEPQQAGRARFELAEACTSTVFKTVSLDRSDIYPSSHPHNRASAPTIVQAPFPATTRPVRTAELSTAELSTVCISTACSSYAQVIHNAENRPHSDQHPSFPHGAHSRQHPFQIQHAAGIRKSGTGIMPAPLNGLLDLYRS